MALRQSDLSFHRPSATGLLGHYPGQTSMASPSQLHRTHLGLNWRKPVEVFEELIAKHCVAMTD
jgi:hypothetical protein